MDRFTIEKDTVQTRYLKNGKYHRVDGPAVIWWDGFLEWWIDGVQYKKLDDWLEVLTDSQKMHLLYSEHFIRG
jgi:hypothetical protein